MSDRSDVSFSYRRAHLSFILARALRFASAVRTGFSATCMIDAQKLIRESGEGEAPQTETVGRARGGAGHRHAGPAVGVTDASRDAGERMRKGRATAAAGQPLYTCAGRQSDTTKVEGGHEGGVVVKLA